MELKRITAIMMLTKTVDVTLVIQHQKKLKTPHPSAFLQLGETPKKKTGSNERSVDTTNAQRRNIKITKSFDIKYSR